MAKCLESPCWSLTCLGHGCLQVFVVYLFISDMARTWSPTQRRKNYLKKVEKEIFTTQLNLKPQLGFKAVNFLSTSHFLALEHWSLLSLYLSLSELHLETLDLAPQCSSLLTGATLSGVMLLFICFQKYHQPYTVSTSSSFFSLKKVYLQPVPTHKTLHVYYLNKFHD